MTQKIISSLKNKALIKFSRSLQTLRNASDYLQEKIVWFDVGARYGLGSTFTRLSKEGRMDIIGFEPDQEECARLNQLDDGITYYPYALGSKNGEADFYITKHPGASSFLKPNEKVLAPYPIRSCFEIEKIVKLKSVTIDSLFDSQLPLPHFIKLDTQGFELEILRGAKQTLEGVHGIQLEAHLEPIYENQALFPEVKQYLKEQGFDLVSLKGSGPFEGKVLELECWFFRNDLSVKSKILKLFFEKISGVDFLPTLAEAHFLGEQSDWKSYLKYVDPREFEILEEIKRLQIKQEKYPLFKSRKYRGK